MNIYDKKNHLEPESDLTNNKYHVHKSLSNIFFEKKKTSK